jgi:hypothetical protein
MSGIVNLLVIVAFGVILADLVAHASGTGTLINGMANMWRASVNGMLGKTS